MSPDISMPDMSSMVAGAEDAIALPAAPMLMGPTMIPSRAATHSNLWNALIIRIIFTMRTQTPFWEDVSGKRGWRTGW